MKLKVKVMSHECICDFCDRASDYLLPINDGAWAICRACFDIEYGVLDRIKNSGGEEE